MKKNKKFTISTTTTIRSSKSGKLEKDMKRIAKSIFSYNPKTDPNDPLFDKTASKKKVVTKKNFNHIKQKPDIR